MTIILISTLVFGVGMTTVKMKMRLKKSQLRPIKSQNQPNQTELKDEPKKSEDVPKKTANNVVLKKNYRRKSSNQKASRKCSRIHDKYEKTKTQDYSSLKNQVCLIHTVVNVELSI